jgi:predicted RNase H-like nuclease (RuvC/YqgF family)
MTTYEITFNERTKIGKDILAFLEQNKKYVKLKDPTKMTKEEYEAKIARGIAQYERGECTVYNNREEFEKLLGVK